MEAGCLGEKDGLTFWLARPEDYDDVMAISEGIYWGDDYVPHRYHTWMTEPNRVVILARRERKLVALESGLVVDGGQTVVGEGLRVCPTERGRGVAGVIQRFIEQYILQLYPSVRVRRLTREVNPGPEKLSKFKVLARRAILSLRGKAETFDGFISHLKAKLNTGEVSDGGSAHDSVELESKMITLMDHHQLKALLLDPDLPSRLQLPGGAIIQDWQPLQPVESNLEVLNRRNLTWLVDGSNEKPMFMSFHTPPYPIPLDGGAFRLNIDLFGTIPFLAKAALTAHLEKVRGELQGTVIFHVYMHPSLWKGMKQFCEGDEGVKQCKEYWEQFLLEVKG
ncbi:histidine N-acetyltransferase-like [Chanos chanos]|uniref:Histidine N-acetyltransferase-like n=1 Tax=Chanos chanos TaxID=29144 RepID=A0A6J2VQ27_CHACN|nr:histidine N-acetyltransferase-like [Chanos chanos]